MAPKDKPAILKKGLYLLVQLYLSLQEISRYEGIFGMNFLGLNISFIYFIGITKTFPVHKEIFDPIYEDGKVFGFVFSCLFSYC